jgi:hypothetical protein
MTNDQRMTNAQASKEIGVNVQIDSVNPLVIGHWDFFGHWSLDFASLGRQA